MTQEFGPPRTVAPVDWPISPVPGQTVAGLIRLLKGTVAL